VGWEWRLRLRQVVSTHEMVDGSGVTEDAAGANRQLTHVRVPSH
jgi:hypothetical protein